MPLTAWLPTSNPLSVTSDPFTRIDFSRHVLDGLLNDRGQPNPARRGLQLEREVVLDGPGRTPGTDTDAGKVVAIHGLRHDSNRRGFQRLRGARIVE